MIDNTKDTAMADGEQTKISLSTKDLSPEDRKMLRSMYLRTNALYALWAGQAQAATSGFMYIMEPALDRYYPDEEQHREALVRHTSWFNITLAMCPLVSSIVAAMERDNSQNPDFDTTSIDAIKASLMGPLSGIGDAIFWGVFRVIAAAVGVSLAASGSVLGPIVFLLIYNAASWIVRWVLNVLGFKLGGSFIAKASESGLMELVTKSATVLGMLMVGAMSASFVSFNIAATIPMPAGDPVAIQTYIDAVFQGLIPLLLTLGCYKLVKKNVNVVWIILGLIVFGLVCGLLGIVA